MKKKFTLLVAIFALALLRVNATTYTVTNVNNAGAGSLRQAIDNANNNAGADVIDFSNTLANQTITIVSPFLVITSDVTINGSGATNLTISGGNASRIFWIQNGTITIQNLTLANGYAKGGDGSGGGMGAGGAIFMHEGRQDPGNNNNLLSGSIDLRLVNVILKNNKAIGGSGGGASLGGGGLGGSGGGGGGGVLGNGDVAGGSVTNASGSTAGTNGGIGIFGNGGVYGGGPSGVGADIPGFGGGGGATGDVGGFGSFGGGGAFTPLRSFGYGGFGGGGGGGEGFGGFGGGGGAGGFGGIGGFSGFGGAGSSSVGGGGAGFGGAIFVTSGKLTLQGVTFDGNTATGGTGANNGKGYGGALFIFNKADNGNYVAPGTTNDPSVVGCSVTYINNKAADDPNSATNNDDLYGAIVYCATCITNPVVTNNADAGPGSLRQAILDACPGSTITFDMSQVVSPINITSGQLVIDKNLTLQGPGANLLNIHNYFPPGNFRSGRVLYVGNIIATLSGLTFSGGYLSDTKVAELGGGILNDGQLTITNCTISDNITHGMDLGYVIPGQGDGIYNNGTLWLSYSTITNNSEANSSTAGTGGGICNIGTAYISYCTISKNNEGYGSGIANYGTMTVSNSTISNNSSVGQFSSGYVSIAGASAVFNVGDLTMTNTTLSGNSPGGLGIDRGEVITPGPTPNATKLTNVTITNNSADGIHVGFTTGWVGPTLSNCLIAGNGGEDYSFDIVPNVPVDQYPRVTSLGYNIFGKANAPFSRSIDGPGDQVGSSDSPINPLLGPLANNGGATLTHALLAGSPAINSGDNSRAANAGLATDQRGSGFPRVGNGGHTVDIGAFEADNTALPLFALADNFSTNANVSISIPASDPHDLLDNDNFGTQTATLSSFGGGSLGGSVTDHVAGATIAFAGGTLKVNADGGFSLSAPSSSGLFTFFYRLSNNTGTSDAKVTIRVFAVCPAPGNIWYVNSAALSGGTGTSWDCAFQHLQDAITAASSGQQIWVAAGTYKSTYRTDAQAQLEAFSMKNGVGIYGGFNGTETLLSQRNWVNNKTILTGDIGTPGVNTDNSSYIVHNQRNGVDNSATLDGFILTGNGYYFNNHWYGSAIYNEATIGPTIANCTFTGNNGEAAMENFFAAPTIINCLFYGNTSTYGTINNYVDYGVSITNCTFSGNSSAYGDVYIGNQSSSFQIKNSILWGNTSGIVNLTPSATFLNSIVQGGCPAGATCSNVLNVDPKFVSASNLRLQTGSPAINAGTNSGAPSTDIDGNPRALTVADPADIGAYEMQPPRPTASVLSVDDTAAICKGSYIILRVTITGGRAPYAVVYTDGTYNYTIPECESGISVFGYPAVTTTFSLVSVTDADGRIGIGNSGTPTITVIQPTIWYPDTDKDGYGASNSPIEACIPISGYVSVGGDCNDQNAAVYPGAAEICDGIDNNCDGQIDEGFPYISYYRDADGDGYGNPTVTTTAKCATPTGYVTNSTDCNDNNAAVHPGATEVCDGIDNNCDGQVDEGFPGITYYRDADGDGYGNPSVTITAKCTAPAGYVANSADCDDNNASVHPGAPEVCDGIDNNCDGQIDEGFPMITYYFDVDGDGYGSPNNPVQARCFQPQNTVTNNLDCDDQNASVHPGAAELCDGLDNDCDGLVDEDFPLVTYYFDVDGDGYGSPNNPVQARCFQPQNTVTNNLDCDDQNASVHPGAAELCDGLDNDCDGEIDEDFPFVTYYFDVDGDGYGSPNNPVQARCFQPQNTVTNSLDCDDQNASVHPSAAELCDGLDNDCDGQIDEDFPLVTYYFDVDGDGYGSPNNPVQARCFQPQNTVTNNLDCDDQNASVHPGAPELCDGLDNDCDGQIDEDFPLVTYYFDVDGDGYGSPNNPVQARCFQPQNTVANSLDCDDQNASVHPGAAELCDGLDNDCDGQIDEDFPLVTYYFDVDGDGYGNPNSPIQARCIVPIGTVSNNLDCDDNNAAIHPGATEICGNGIDDNCNGQIDENCANNIRFTIADKAKLEGNGQRTISFIVKLSKASTQTVQVSYTTQNITALAGPDYTAKTGTLIFAPGVRKQTINITINGDRIVEPDETFRILLSNPVNAALPDNEAIGTIINDDATAVAATVEPTTTAAKSVTVTTGLKVSPNPATTALYVQLTGYKGNVTLQLRSLDGKVLIQQKLQTGNTKMALQKMEVAHLSNGTYLLTAIDEKGNIQTEKVIISK